jgi:hypothetical protein
VREHRLRDRLHVVRRHERASGGKRTRLRDAQQLDPGARAGAEIEARIGPRVPEHGDDVPVDALLDVQRFRVLDHGEHVLGAANGLQRVLRRVRRLLRQHPRLFREGRIAERKTHREAVELRLGQRVRPFVLDRVLRRRDHEDAGARS